MNNTEKGWGSRMKSIGKKSMIIRHCFGDNRDYLMIVHYEKMEIQVKKLPSHSVVFPGRIDI